DSRMFIYHFSSGEIVDISYDKSDGTNDFDPRFSLNEAEVIFVNTSNDGISPKNIYIQSIGADSNENESRTELVQNATMPGLGIRINHPIFEVEAVVSNGCRFCF
ncbi:hypothetical protein RM529_17860, partial [Zunongwangia sp. F297]|nr:hypothetical protein [Zunongwangia sp. F297]